MIKLLIHLVFLNLTEIRRIKNKSKEQDALYNVETLYNARNSVIKFFDDYTSVVSENKYKTIHGEGIEILILKEIIQRLPKGFTHVKPGNTSENVLIEVC